MKVRKKQLTITCKIFLCSWKNCLFLKFHFLVVYWPLTWWWWWWRWLLGNFFCLFVDILLTYYRMYVTRAKIHFNLLWIKKEKQVSKIIYRSILGCVSLYRRWLVIFEYGWPLLKTQPTHHHHHHYHYGRGWLNVYYIQVSSLYLCVWRCYPPLLLVIIIDEGYQE